MKSTYHGNVTMASADWVEATRLIKAVIPECKVILLTSAEDDASLYETIKSGASGYLLKSLQAAELFDLLASLERGEAGKLDAGNNVETAKLSTLKNL